MKTTKHSSWYRLVDSKIIEIKGSHDFQLINGRFKFVTVKKIKLKEKELSPRVRKLRGIIKTDDNFDYKQILTEELSKKYGV